MFCISTASLLLFSLGSALNNCPCISIQTQYLSRSGVADTAMKAGIDTTQSTTTDDDVNDDNIMMAMISRAIRVEQNINTVDGPAKPTKQPRSK